MTPVLPSPTLPSCAHRITIECNFHCCAVPDVLATDLDSPNFLSHLAPPMKTFLWWGAGGQVTKAHYDTYDNFFCVLKGSKKLLLYAPWEAHLISPYTARASGPYISIDLADPFKDEARDPAAAARFRLAARMVADVRGEAHCCQLTLAFKELLSIVAFICFWFLLSNDHFMWLSWVVAQLVTACTFPQCGITKCYLPTKKRWHFRCGFHSLWAQPDCSTTGFRQIPSSSPPSSEQQSVIALKHGLWISSSLLRSRCD